MRALILFASISFLGCGSDDSPSTTVTDTGTSTTDTGTSTTDTGTSATDTMMASDTPAPPATDLTFDADFIGKGGPHFITGTITLPTGASEGRPVQFEVLRKGSGNQLGLAGKTKAGSTLTYKITGLEAGDYMVGARVDQTNNGMVNDKGDYIGFAKGTVAAPKTTSASADTITVAGGVTGVDFGLGVVP
jgi:hypothetical protein